MCEISRCKIIEYDLQNLPSASIIIVFNDEKLSILLRTIHSIINRTPSQLVKEIILVDDFSDYKELQGTLERYLTTKFPPLKIRLIRVLSRTGLIRAKMIGAHLAVGDVLVFLDAHCEVGHTWLEPLLQRVNEKRTAVVSPEIETISSSTLEYSTFPVDYHLIAIFGWNLYFFWDAIPEHELKRKATPESPTRSPTMAGGLLAINRKYFWEIGSYDPGMKLWGGENLEMSFRIWQCGGSIEIIPCSRVGHIYHVLHPHSPGNDKTHTYNTMRLVEVWLDDYRDIFYRYGETLKNESYGDVSKRVALRKRLKCKTFGWYLDNIYPKLFKMEKDSLQFGQVINNASGICLDNLLMNPETNERYPLGTYNCISTLLSPLAEQYFFLRTTGEFRRLPNCARATTNGDNSTGVELVECDKVPPGEKWEYKNSMLINLPSGRCLTLTANKEGTDNLRLESCNASLSSQQWTFSNVIPPWSI